MRTFGTVVGDAAAVTMDAFGRFVAETTKSLVSVTVVFIKERFATSWTTVSQSSHPLKVQDLLDYTIVIRFCQ